MVVRLMGNVEVVDCTGEEGAGLTDFTRGQECALGVSVFAFVLFWSDNGQLSCFFFCFFVFVRLTHCVNQRIRRQSKFENTKTSNVLAGNG